MLETIIVVEHDYYMFIFIYTVPLVKIALDSTRVDFILVLFDFQTKGSHIIEMCQQFQLSSCMVIKLTIDKESYMSCHLISHELSFNISFNETIIGKPLVRFRTALEEFSVKLLLK